MSIGCPRSLLLPKRIQNHEAHCLHPVTPCVYRDPVTALPATRDCGAATSTCCVSENNETSADKLRVVHFNVTEHPTAQWTGQQIIEAFPWDTAPKYLLRDRDAIYGNQFQKRVKSMGIEEMLTAPRSPWQNAFVERVIGSIRRDCLDHVVVLNDRHLKRILTSYFTYYHSWRTHLSLGMDSPESRSVQPPAPGKVVQFPEVGGLHHHYERLAA